MSQVKTFLLLFVMAAILIGIGGLIGGANGALVAFIISLVINGVSYWFSDKIVLAMYRAKELPRSEYPRIYEVVEGLSQVINIPPPRVYMVPMEAPNAFATGRDPRHGVLCLTKGLLGSLDKEEIKGVISHELGHIKNRDTLIMTVAAAFASGIMMLANMARWGAIFGGSRDDRNSSNNVVVLIAISIIAPLAALLVQLAISRSREYDADAAGARMTGDPESLARALEDLSRFSRKVPAPVSPETAHLFIVSPLSMSAIANLFSTHPPLEERVKRLRSLK